MHSLLSAITHLLQANAVLPFSQLHRTPHWASCWSVSSKSLHYTNYVPLNLRNFPQTACLCRSCDSRGLRRVSAAARYWDCGLQSRRGYGCLSLVNVVCSQVDVGRTDRSSRGVLLSVCVCVCHRVRSDATPVEWVGIEAGRPRQKPDCYIEHPLFRYIAFVSVTEP